MKWKTKAGTKWLKPRFFDHGVEMGKPALFGLGVQFPKQEFNWMGVPSADGPKQVGTTHKTRKLNRSISI